MKEQKHTAPPYRLGEVMNASDFQGDPGSGGQYVTIDAEGHGALAFVVWRMEDDERSPKLEETANFIVRACNEHVEFKQKAESYDWLKQSAIQHGGITLRMRGDTMSVVHGAIDEDVHAGLIDALKAAKEELVSLGGDTFTPTTLVRQIDEALGKAGVKA